MFKDSNAPKNDTSILLFHIIILVWELPFSPLLKLTPLITPIPYHPYHIILTTTNISGICKLCEQLNLDPLEDVRVLVLLWKLGANKKPAEIQKEEFMTGCHKLQVDSIDKFKKTLPALDTGFMDRGEFSDFYKVCNNFMCASFVM